MSIVSRANYQDSYKQTINISKQSIIFSNTWQWCSYFSYGDDPPAGSLSPSNTTSGIVPVSSDTGYPKIQQFKSGASGYITAINNACCNLSSGNYQLKIFDRLFLCGSYDYNASVTLSSQPSYSSRLPFKSDGSTTDYNGTEIWVESNNGSQSGQTVTVTYTNQDGTTGRSTGAFAIGTTLAAPIIRQIPLQSGDTGVQKIESVTGGVTSSGTSIFNIMVLRPLCNTSFSLQRKTVSESLFRFNMPQVFQTSALYVVGQTSSVDGMARMSIEISSL
jgi:hypothetical protein